MVVLLRYTHLDGLQLNILERWLLVLTLLQYMWPSLVFFVGTLCTIPAIMAITTATDCGAYGSYG